MKEKKETAQKCDDCNCKPGMKNSNASGCAIYGIGIFGAAFYFFPLATGAEQFVMAFLKSLVWPALLVYHALKLLGL